MIDDATLNEWAAVFDDYHRVHAGQCTGATRAVERRLLHMVPLLIAEVQRLRAERGIYCTGCGVLITREMDDADKRLVATQEHVAQCQSHPLYQAVSELNAVTADRDRLRHELDDTKAQLEACEIWRDQLRAAAAKARQPCTECPNCDRLQRELDEARAQVAKGKP